MLRRLLRKDVPTWFCMVMGEQEPERKGTESQICRNLSPLWASSLK